MNFISKAEDVHGKQFFSSIIFELQKQHSTGNNRYHEILGLIVVYVYIIARFKLFSFAQDALHSMTLTLYSLLPSTNTMFLFLGF